MVTKKTHKTSKVSYAERVLGAFTQVQREHRKHSIHVATVRAQVKRNALENKEKLGPNWSSWVGNAIKKLEDDGILESSQSVVGNISLTPSGKKAIADARQSLSAMTDTSPAAVPEDLVWKYLTHATPPVPGTKRGRVSMIRQSQDEPASVRPKRRRISTIAPSLPNPRERQMTKSQLQAELHALQKQKANWVWLRESSPLTDLDKEEEVEKLRDELKKKQEEVERIKQELIEAKTNNSLISSTNQAYRPLTPEIHTRPSSPIQPSTRVQTLSSSLSLVRTQSGSLISLLSRQPTPPHSPGGGSDALLETQGTEEDFMLREDRAQTGTSAPLSNDPRVIELERDVASRVVTIENLEAQLSQVQENLAAAQQAVLERDGRLSSLSTSFSKLHSDASQKALDLERQIAQLQELASLNVGLESTQSSRLADLEHELDERNMVIKTIRQDREKDIAEVALLRDSLSAAEQDKATLVSQLTDSEAQLQKYRFEGAEQRNADDIKLQSQRKANEELEGKLEALLTRISVLDQEVQVLQQYKDSAEASLLEASSEQTLALSKLREAEASNESLLGQLTIATDEKSELQAILDIYKDRVAALYTRLSSTAPGKEDVISMAQEVAAASTLGAGLALAEQSTNRLTARLEATMQERIELLSQLDDARATISVSASSVAQFKDRLITTEDNLTKAQNAAAEFHLKLDATADKLDSYQERNQALVAEVESKQAELALLAQRLSAAESLTEQYHTEVISNRTTAQELHEQLSIKETELKAAHDFLSSTQANHAFELGEQVTKILELETLAQGRRTEIDTFKLHLSSIQSEKAELQREMAEQTVELGEAKTKLFAESQCIIRLETEIAIATERLQEVEEELSELRSSKAADEVTIETMKDMFSTHVEKQTQSLAVLNSQIISTKSSPAPSKRRSTRTTAKAIPFRLT